MPEQFNQNHPGDQNRQFNQNRLTDAASPYLQQHKDNPVHWQPWEPAVFDEARRRGVPVLLSVGYAACHWCHVMAHESFEDEEVAAVMNAHYVCIKLDREERPDLDDIYMTALAMMNEPGGWPLTMFLDADTRPFWGGTYFPKTPQYGRPGFVQVLHELSRLYHAQPGRITKTAKAVTDGLRARAEADAHGDMPADMPDRAATALAAHMDHTHGGLSGAPKFPQPFLYHFLLRQAQLSDDAALTASVHFSVQQMARGGLYDHIGGGFARYSVDAQWLVPHFEKMLYDNALLLPLMCQLYRTTDDTMLARRIDQTIAWLAREMITSEGAFAASLDADTEGEEGRFYIWTPAQIEAAISARAAAFCTAYDITETGNFEGRNIPHRLNQTRDYDEDEFAADRVALLHLRNIRIRPSRDDKILADWNAMMITALADAAQLFDRPDWQSLAETAFDGAITALTGPDATLRHSARDGHQLDTTLASDLAFMAQAGTALFALTGKSPYLTAAEDFMAQLEAGFLDNQRGGYFLTRIDAKGLLVRNRPVHDNAAPSANAAILDALARLAAMTGKPTYRARGAALFTALAGHLSSQYPSMTSLLAARYDMIHSVSVTICGPDGDTKCTLLAAATAHPLTAKYTLWIPENAILPASHPAAAKQADASSRVPTVFICPGLTCLAPVTRAKDVTSTLDALLTARQAL